MNNEKKTGARQSGRRTWGLYLLSLTAWVSVVIAVAFAGFWICSSLTWYDTFLYRLLNWVREYIVFVVLVTVIAGWAVISYYFIARPVENLELVVEAAAALAHPGEAPIRLPDSLRQAQDQLNLAREQALRDAQAVRDAEQRKNDLVVYLAHDLKTPLTSLIGYLTLLRDEPELSLAFRARYTGVALEKAERLETLINEFFDITRFSLSHLEIERESVDLTRMLQQVCSEFEPMLQKRAMRCQLDLPSVLTVSCDRDKMARVFDNLLNNACHYGYANSTLHVAGQQTNVGVVLTFQNAGPTIPPEKLARMFEQFFRIDTARGSDTGNAGLGLAIAREIVEAHGGTITASSADEQICFTVALPTGRP